MATIFCADTITPKVGDIWILKQLPETKLEERSGTAYRHFRQWSEMNDFQVKVDNIEGRTYDDGNPRSPLYHFLVMDDAGAWSITCRCTSFYFHTLVSAGEPIYQASTCCRPSIGLCNKCREAFKTEMIAAGKEFNPWLRTWQ